MLSISDEYDSKTGVRHDELTDKFQISNSELEFSGNDLIINGIKYIGTPGFYELIFKKESRGYKHDDLINYHNILKERMRIKEILVSMDK